MRLICIVSHPAKNCYGGGLDLAPGDAEGHKQLRLQHDPGCGDPPEVQHEGRRRQVQGRCAETNHHREVGRTGAPSYQTVRRARMRADSP